MNRARIAAFVSGHQFVFAVAAVVVIAGIMTAISLSLYVSSGTLQLDLSRPGYEAARKEIINSDQGTEFATNGPVDKKSLEQYQSLFDSQRKELDSISKFKDEGLGDESLTLSQDTPTQ